MQDPYRMIVVNVVASLVVGIGLIIYKFIYPKKKINLFCLLLIITTLPILSILREGSYNSGDLSLHTKYAMQFFDNLSQGNLIPKWTGNHCNSYGCPEFIFIFILPYYLISVFHLLGFQFISSVKILLISSFFISGIGMYMWVKDELGKKPAFVASIFYLFAPYHLIDLHFRVSIGELLSFAILPFIFLLTKRLMESKKAVYFLLTSLFLALLILSHQATSLVSLPFIVLYGGLIWFRDKNKKISTVFPIFIAIIFGIGLTAFYWLPILAESKFILYGIGNGIGFHPFLEYFYSPYRFGLLFQGHMGELYLIVGYTQWVIFVASIYLLFKKKIERNDKHLLILLLVSLIVLFILMQSFTRPVWDLFYFAKNIQFSWRLLIEISLFVSVIAGIVVKYTKSKTLIIILCFVTIFYTILNWGNRKSEPTINDIFLRNQHIFTDPKWYELTTPKWVRHSGKWVSAYPKGHIEVISGKANILQIKRLITKHEYIIDVKQDALLKENTYFYPGWKITANNKYVNIMYKNSKYPGVITFILKKGIYIVKVEFTDTTDRIAGKYITIITVIFLSLTTFILSRKKILKTRTSSKA